MENVKERVVLVYINENKIKRREEFIQLALAADMDVIEVIDVNLKEIRSSTYFGKGKVVEIAEILKYHEAELVIVSKELSPLQSRNLETLFECIIMDRTALILEIFLSRASTREAKLQIEAAQLRCLLPKLVGSTTYLGRQGGGKNKGAGEKKLELDRRVIKKQIAILNQQLKELEKQRLVRSSRRKNSRLPLVSLVGYTNAGKSTIMNAMLGDDLDEDKKVFAKDMLFATLDTSIRRIHHQHHDFLLSDTVGFISDLPHDLIQAFHSTLEEACEADLILHVVDVSDPYYMEQVEISNQTLLEIGAAHIPVIYIYNKADISDHFHPRLVDDSLFISAKDEAGITLLKDTICKQLWTHETIKLQIPYDEVNLIEECIAKKERFIVTYEDQYVSVEYLSDEVLEDKWKPFVMKR